MRHRLTFDALESRLAPSDPGVPMLPPPPLSGQPVPIITPVNGSVGTMPDPGGTPLDYPIS